MSRPAIQEHDVRFDVLRHPIRFVMDRILRRVVPSCLGIRVEAERHTEQFLFIQQRHVYVAHNHRVGRVYTLESDLDITV